MPRRHYLVSYDVADDKRRNRIFKLLQGQGDHVQYSVFLCQLNDRERASLRGRLTELVHAREDQVLVVDLGAADHDLDADIETIGRAFAPPVRVLVV